MNIKSNLLNFKYNFELLNKCIDDNIPIIRNNTAQIIFDYINKINAKQLLEIGSAYGYSADLFAQSKTLTTIVSLEKNLNNWTIANKYKIHDNIQFINIDAFDYVPKNKYDIIFIDGPKSNQIVLIQKYIKYLSKNGYMFIDNLFLNKLNSIPVDQLNKNQIKLINKINELNIFLKTNTKFNYKLINIDDGLGVIWKK